MALAQYTDKFWFPNGVLATAMPARIFPVNSNGLAPLFSDAAGTIALPNPLNTDGAGFLTFYATAGQYWIHLDSESFLVDVGMSQEQADLSTGVASGGDMDPNALNPKAVDVAALIGYVVDNTQIDAGTPSVTRVDSPAQTVVLDAPAQARVLTWWLMDSAGTVTQQGTAPTNTQRRTHLVLGLTVYDTVAGTILEAQTIQVVLGQPANAYADLTDSLGPFSVSGNAISANGVNLSFNKTSGTVFARSFNRFVGALLTEDPNVSAVPAQTPVQFHRTLQVPGPTGPVVTTLDPANYDVGGVLTPVGGGAGTATVQRVYMFATNLVTNQLVVQYGQSTHASLSAAVSALSSAAFTPSPNTVVGTLIGHIAVVRTATDLSDPTQATFILAGKFSKA